MSYNRDHSARDQHIWHWLGHGAACRGFKSAPRASQVIKYNLKRERICRSTENREEDRLGGGRGSGEKGAQGFPTPEQVVNQRHRTRMQWHRKPLTARGRGHGGRNELRCPPLDTPRPMASGSSGTSPASRTALEPRRRRGSARSEQPLQGPLRLEGAAAQQPLRPRSEQGSRRRTRDPTRSHLFPRVLSSRATDGPSCFPRPPGVLPSPAAEEEVVAAALWPAYVVVAPEEARGGGGGGGEGRGICIRLAQSLPRNRLPRKRKREQSSSHASVSHRH